MKFSLETFEKLAKARTPGEWPKYHEVVPNEYGAGCPTLPPSDCDFIAYAANHADEMIEYIRKLEKALEFYAEKKHYNDNTWDSGFIIGELRPGWTLADDRCAYEDGLIARKALEQDN